MTTTSAAQCREMAEKMRSGKAIRYDGNMCAEMLDALAKHLDAGGGDPVPPTEEFLAEYLFAKQADWIAIVRRLLVLPHSSHIQAQARAMIADAPQYAPSPQAPRADYGKIASDKHWEECAIRDGTYKPPSAAQAESESAHITMSVERLAQIKSDAYADGQRAAQAEQPCPDCEGAGCVECDGPQHRCPQASLTSKLVSSLESLIECIPMSDKTVLHGPVEHARTLIKQAKAAEQQEPVAIREIRDVDGDFIRYEAQPSPAQSVDYVCVPREPDERWVRALQPHYGVRAWYVIRDVLAAAPQMNPCVSSERSCES